MTDELTFAIAGIAGRMGGHLARAAFRAGHTVTGGTEAPGSPKLGEDIGTIIGAAPLEVSPVTDPVQAAAGANVWVDFTTPAATLAALDALKLSAVQSVIIGTTGFSDGDERAIQSAAEHFAIVKAGNFSLGVNLMTALTKLAAERLGPDWDIEILETHHRRKIDAPSGTALMLGEAAAAGRGTPLSELAASPYDGPDAAREPGKIGFAVRRVGDVIGDHDVTFGSDMELLTLRHVALDRAVFADGAIYAAQWAAKAAPGLYDMSDVLGI